MLKDKLTIYADKTNEECIRQLVSDCIQSIDINMVSLAAADSGFGGAVSFDKDLRCVVLPFGFDAKIPEGVRQLTYSINGTKGDIAALNVQKRTQCTCFEVLYGVFMSRVFIPLESIYTVEQVLLCICILCGWGASIDKLVPLVNELLK